MTHRCPECQSDDLFNAHWKTRTEQLGGDGHKILYCYECRGCGCFFILIETVMRSYTIKEHGDKHVE